jgi:CRP-like cAMP-binding protein
MTVGEDMSKSVDNETLGNTILGRELDDDECGVLAGIMTLRELNAGDVLVNEGDGDRTLFVLIQGQINVSSTVQGGAQETVCTMRPGDCAGTGAFVEGTQRLATLISNGDSILITLEPDAFESLLDDHPRLVYKVMRALFHARHDNLIQLHQENEQLTNYIAKVHGRY